MAKKNTSWLGRELSYLFLAPFFVLIGVVGYGILFDKWHKDPMLLLQYSGMAYGAILVLRFISWTIRALSR
jgi:hypothetical protein